jgi:rhodanese-related sulfurtransferase
MIAAIDPDELARRLQAGELGPHQVVDVREDDEYISGHVPGARHIVMAAIPQHLDALKAIESLTVICHSGGRSQRVCQWLSGQGVDAVNVMGGTAGWAALQYPLETGPAAAIEETP